MTKPAISANSQITETPTLYVDNIDPKFRDIAPRVIDDQDKGQIYVINDMRDRVSMSLTAAAGEESSTMSKRGANFKELHRGGWDPEARKASQDRHAVKPLLKSGATALGRSDAGAHASQLCGTCLPTYFLGKWVSEKQSFSVEEAVRMLTSRPADVAGISDRDLLAEGRPADIAVFDPETVGAGKFEGVYDFPAGADRLVARPQGVRAVVVNGTTLRENGVEAISLDGDLPVSVIRNRQAAA